MTNTLNDSLRWFSVPQISYIWSHIFFHISRSCNLNSISSVSFLFPELIPPCSLLQALHASPSASGFAFSFDPTRCRGRLLTLQAPCSSLVKVNSFGLKYQLLSSALPLRPTRLYPECLIFEIGDQYRKSATGH